MQVDTAVAQTDLVTAPDKEKAISGSSIHLASPDEGLHIVQDSTNPLIWSRRRKWSIVGVLSLMSLAGNFGTLMCAPSSPQILRSLGSTDQIYATLIISIWELGEGMGPLIIAPLSELYGRRVVYNGTNIAFVLFIGLSAASVNLPMLIVMRFLSGITVASVTLNPCVVGDIFVQEERGKAMSWISFPQLLGPVAGPIIGGYVAQDVGWRLVFGVCAIFAGISGMAVLLVYRETYPAAILGRRAKHADYGNSTDISKTKLKVTPPGVKESVIRPLRLLLFSPAVAILSLYIALAYGYIYIVFTTLAPVFENTYHFRRGPVGLTFLGVALGIAVGVLLCSRMLDAIVKVHKNAERPMLPEHRLSILTVGSVSIVAGLILFGWSTEAKLHWVVPITGTAIIGFGLVTTMISTNTYLVDAFPSYAASAMAAIGVLRSFSAAGLPLVGPPLYRNLGLGLGNSVLACIAALGVPITFVLMHYGQRLRQKLDVRG